MVAARTVAVESQGGARLGRPRDAELDAAILDAAVELLSEVGFDRLRVQDVADRAGVGLATIYRRWRTRRELLLAAMDKQTRETLLPPARTGDARTDLVAYITRLADDIAGKDADLLPGVFAAIRADPPLLDAFRDQLLGTLRGQLRSLLEEALALPRAELDLRADIVPSMLMLRALIGQPVTRREATRLADLLLAPPPS